MANLKRGSTGEEVLEVQKALGFTGKDLDGIYGPKTEAAVINFQKNNGAQVDGIVGPETRGKLFGAGTTNTNAGGNTNTNAGTNNAGAGNGGAQKPVAPAAPAATPDPAPTPKDTFTTPAGNTYGTYTPEEVTYDPLVYSDVVNQAFDILGQLQGNAPGAWSDPYRDQYLSYLSQYENRDPFSYDFNSDALYQQYKDQYIQQGRMAMMDTMGQAAAMTGGYGNSYAQSVGQQTYNQYLGQLNEIIPELYDRAYNRYNQEGQNLLNMYNAYLGLSEKEYNQYLGEVDNYYRQLGAASDYAFSMADKEFNEWANKTGLDIDIANAKNNMGLETWATQLGITSSENQTLMDQKFKAEQNDIDRADEKTEIRRNELINLMTSTGYNPTPEELEKYGIPESQVPYFQQIYKDSQKTTTIGDGGAEDTVYTDLDVGTLTEWDDIAKKQESWSGLENVWRSMKISKHDPLYAAEYIMGLAKYYDKIPTLEELKDFGDKMVKAGIPDEDVVAFIMEWQGIFGLVEEKPDKYPEIEKGDLFIKPAHRNGGTAYYQAW